MSRRGNDSKVEGLLMSYISLWQHLYRLGGHGARARSLLLESPAGIPWEQGALVTVGGEQDRERERERWRRGQREDGGIRTGPPGGPGPGLVGGPVAPSFRRAPGTLSGGWAGWRGQGLSGEGGVSRCLTVRLASSRGPWGSWAWPSCAAPDAQLTPAGLGPTLTQQMRRPPRSSDAGSAG